MAFKRKSEGVDSGVRVKDSTPPEDGGTPTTPAQATQVTQPRRSRVSSTVPGVESQAVLEPNQTSGKKEPSISSTTIIGVCICAVVGVVGAVMMFGDQGNVITGSQTVNNNPVVSTSPTDTAPKLSDEEKLKKDLEDEGYGADAAVRQGANIQVMVSSDSFVKDLDGNKTPEMFKVKAITNIHDFVTYKKHRAVTGDGVELYWLEGKYKGQNCRVTVPYKYFQELSEEGAVVCSVEIVQTTEGHKIATYFQFDPEIYKKLTKK